MASGSMWPRILFCNQPLINDYTKKMLPSVKIREKQQMKAISVYRSTVFRYAQNIRV